MDAILVVWGHGFARINDFGLSGGESCIFTAEFAESAEKTLFFMPASPENLCVLCDFCGD